MNDITIRAKNLSKRYQIKEKVPYKALRDVLGNFITGPFRKFKGSSKKTSFNGCIWALKDVSFEIKKGEVVGIVGSNGAGKTTLLKILSRITYPTEGLAEIYGRIGSLLEIGTGFHPELTGRDNIYLNGAILGMMKKEIDNKFDEIVTFSEIEKFIDTPVKYYSGGMYTRLAFAVAAHMEPEILLVDEVLAVGDLAFQKKCLGKMDDVAKRGRTVLFVSHNMQAISQLCPRTILLKEGRLLKDGPSTEVLNSYVGMLSDASIYEGERDLSSPTLRLPASDPESFFKFTHIKVINLQKEPTTEIFYYEPFEVIFLGSACKKCDKVLVGFGIASKTAGFIFSSHQLFHGLPDTLAEGISEFHIEMNPNILAPGYYEIHIGAIGPGVSDYIFDAFEFEILNLGVSSDKSWHPPHQVGVIDYPCKWRIEPHLK